MQCRSSTKMPALRFHSDGNGSVVSLSSPERDPCAMLLAVGEEDKNKLTRDGLLYCVIPPSEAKNIPRQIMLLTASRRCYAQITYSANRLDCNVSFTKHIINADLKNYIRRIDFLFREIP